MEMSTISGMDGVFEALAELPKGMASRAGGPAKKALSAGARLIRDEAIRRAPQRSGNMAALIRTVRDPNPRATEGASERFIVGIKGGARKPYAKSTHNSKRKGTSGHYVAQGSAWYWRFVEFGTENQSAQPFLQPALEAKGEAAIAVITSIMKVEVDILVERVARRARRAARRR